VQYIWKAQSIFPGLGMRLAEVGKVDLRLAVDFAWARLALRQLAGRREVGLRETGRRAPDWEELAGLAQSGA
jgi:hypothetical protein